MKKIGRAKLQKYPTLWFIHRQSPHLELYTMKLANKEEMGAAVTDMSQQVAKILFTVQGIFYMVQFIYCANSTVRVHGLE